jgi:RHS repeat-associated protein
MATYEGPGGTASAGYHFHLTDWLGTQRVQTTANGNVSDLCYSYPFGDGLSCTGTDATEHHFTGKERDTESGLDYFGGRYLSSGLGRWMTTDKDFTLKRILPNPQKWNRYAYVLNNPLVLFDPDGLAEWYVFRPLIPARSKMSPQWQKAINTATARGDNVHMMLGKDATVKAFEQALKTPGAYVEAITHASPGGITLSDGSSQGSYGSTSSSMSQSSNPAEGITANVTGTSEVQVTAQEVAIVGCQSSSLDYQYSDTTFVGVDPGAGGGITTDLGSAIGASFLQAGGDQAGVDAGNSDIDSSQDSRNDGANVEMTPPSTPPSQPTSPPAQP